MKPKRAKAVLAWGIFQGDKLAVYDVRLPILWLKQPAIREKKRRCLDGRIARVGIREIKR